MKDVTRSDSVAMTPEELVEAINAYKSSKGGGSAEEPTVEAGDGINKEGGMADVPTEPVAETPAAESGVEPNVPTETPVHQCRLHSCRPFSCQGILWQ